MILGVVGILIIGDTWLHEAWWATYLVGAAIGLLLRGSRAISLTKPPPADAGVGLIPLSRQRRNAPLVIDAASGG